jgi:hypothetical protein
MVRLSRATLGPLAIVILIIGVAIAGYIGVSKLGYPTVATYPATSDAAGRAEPVAGSDIPRVILSQDAAVRIGLRTTAVSSRLVDGKQQLSIPYSAVYYDPSGQTWTYVATEPLVFVRQAITVVSIIGDVAVLSAGPAADTKVVIAGSAQLYGTEVGVEEE